MDEPFAATVWERECQPCNGLVGFPKEIPKYLLFCQEQCRVATFGRDNRYSIYAICPELNRFFESCMHLRFYYGI